MSDDHKITTTEQRTNSEAEDLAPTKNDSSTTVTFQSSRTVLVHESDEAEELGKRVSSTDFVTSPSLPVRIVIGKPSPAPHITELARLGSIKTTTDSDSSLRKTDSSGDSVALRRGLRGMKFLALAEKNSNRQKPSISASESLGPRDRERSSEKAGLTHPPNPLYRRESPNLLSPLVRSSHSRKSMERFWTDIMETDPKQMQWIAAAQALSPHRGRGLDDEENQAPANWLYDANSKASLRLTEAYSGETPMSNTMRLALARLTSSSATHLLRANHPITPKKTISGSLTKLLSPPLDGSVIALGLRTPPSKAPSYNAAEYGLGSWEKSIRDSEDLVSVSEGPYSPVEPTRARSVPPDPAKRKTVPSRAKQILSCRVGQSELERFEERQPSRHSIFSTGSAIVVGTPLWMGGATPPPAESIRMDYTFQDQLESNRMREERERANMTPCTTMTNMTELSGAPASKTPGKFAGAFTGWNMASSDPLSPTESASTTHQTPQINSFTPHKRKMKSPTFRRFKFTPKGKKGLKSPEVALRLPKWFNGVSSVPETKTLSEAGYFKGTWKLPHGREVTIASTNDPERPTEGRVLSTDLKLKCSCLFLGNRTVLIEYMDGTKKKARLSTSGDEIEFEDGSKSWKQVADSLERQPSGDPTSPGDTLRVGTTYKTDLSAIQEGIAKRAPGAKQRDLLGLSSGGDTPQADSASSLRTKSQEELVIPSLSPTTAKTARCLACSIM